MSKEKITTLEAEKLITKISECNKSIKDLTTILAIMQKDNQETSITVSASEKIRTTSDIVKDTSKRIAISQEKTPAIYNAIIDAVSKDLEQYNKDIKIYAGQLYKGM
ncbi:MAG: hypothetical protein MJ152_04160 [Clostridia bacterium]|nr:hypothetical protein [Clostridia bacterium]